MIKNKLSILVTALLLSLSAASNANQPVESTAPATTAAINPFDINTWISSFAGTTPPTISGEVKFTAAHPGAWMAIVDPASHMQMHSMFANPASYTQFMQPQFYMEFAKPENMAAWMNPASYQVMMNPQTMNYWMNPETYTHMVDPAMYQQTMNPANYMIYMNPNTYLAAMMGSQTCDPENPNAAQGCVAQ
jgi:hypothetical protein